MEPTDLTRRLLDSTVDFVVIHSSLEGEVQAWLGASERVLGYTAKEAIGLSLSALFTEEDRLRKLDVTEIALARSQGRSEDDRWHVRKDGSRFWASGVLMVVEGEDGRPIGLCKVLRDKTDTRTRIDSLENTVAHLRSELEAERTAVSALAHELRNPMMPIVSALTLLQRPDAARVFDKAVKILVNQTGVLRRLLDDLNAVSHAPASANRLDLEPVNLNATLSELLDSLQDAAKSRNQTLTLVLPPHDILVWSDPPRLQQMLLNLLNNSLKYTGEFGHIAVSATVEAEMAVVRVDDDGIGISPEILPRIFELFTREGRQADVEGQGVGLAVVKQLATAHGGFIEARSAGLNKGANFSLRIPVHR